MINVTNISKSFGGQLLFENVSFTVSQGERVGLVGRNGTGKSTLFKILLEKEAQDNGSFEVPKGYRLGSLEQHIHFSKNKLLDECIEVLPKHHEYDHFRAEKILFGLGFSSEDLNKDPLSFSGGYQVRINLAKALLKDPNMLLLDEPTNYLDIVSLNWLKGFLKSFPGEVILITHDREFMDSVCTHIMGINHHKLKKIKGTTEKYYQQIEAEEIIFEQTRLNQQKKVKEIQDFVDRFRAKASKAKQAQSRLKMLSRMEILGKSDSDADFGFSFHYSPLNAKTLLSVDNLSFGYGEQKDLFDSLKFSIGNNERVAIIGKNGKGKSTLLNVLAGVLKARTGDIRFHNDIKLGHFGQTNIERLHPNHTIVQEIQNANPDLNQTAIRNICGCMMFEAEKADKKISVLSGGERSRVMLGKILAKPSNLLFLDEPTNHLDMESIEVLTEEIESFPGAVVLVTHSEMLLKRLANRLIIFKDGRAEYFHGSYQDFLDKVGWEDSLPNEEETAEKLENKIGFKEKKRLRNQLIAQRNKEILPLREDIEKFENDIDQLEKLLEKFSPLIQAKVDKGEDALELMQQVKLMNEKIEENFLLLENAQNSYDEIFEKFDNQLKELE